MSEDDAKVIDKSMVLDEFRAALCCGGDDFKKVHAQAVRDGIALIERLTAEVERLTLRWTSDSPTVPGLYLWRWKTELGWRENHRPIRITDADLEQGGWLVEFGHQYAGPIAEPLGRDDGPSDAKGGD